MKTWDWSRLSERGCFFFLFCFLFGVNTHVFCKCLKYIGNMCSRVAHVRQMLPRKTNATCALFLKYGYGECERLITRRKGDFCFEVMGIKAINDSLPTLIPMTSHWDQSICLTTNTHKPFSLCSNVYHRHTEKKLDLSKGHSSGYWTPNALLINS